MSDGPLVIILPGEREAEHLISDLKLFVDDVMLFPSWETLPFEHVSPNTATMAQRAEVRYRLSTDADGLVVVSSIRAAIQRVSTSSTEPVVVERGTEVVFEDLVRRLDVAGYTRTDRVESRGEFAVRGGIIDVFPSQSDHAVRIDFWGDDVDDIRTFSIGSQRSIEQIEKLRAFPAREFRSDAKVQKTAWGLKASEPWASSIWDRFTEGVRFAGMESWLPWLTRPCSFLDELPDTATLVLFDPVRARSRASDLVKEEQDLAEALSDTWGDRYRGEGTRPSLFLDLDSSLPERRFECPPLPTRPEDPKVEVGVLDVTPGDPESVVGGLSRLIGRGIDVVLAMDGDPAARRVARILGEHGLDLPLIENFVTGTRAGDPGRWRSPWCGAPDAEVRDSGGEGDRRKEEGPPPSAPQTVRRRTCISRPQHR